MGDAVLCTPALRALRTCLHSCNIYFFADNIIRSALSPCDFNDHWLEQTGENPFTVAGLFRKYKFKQAILFKNSFASALTVWLAQIPMRTGYARQGRGFLLTERLHPPRLSSGNYKPASMIDYYLAIAGWLGAETSNRTLELKIDPQNTQQLHDKIPAVANPTRPVVVLVPGGAFGPSKCWPTEKFGQIADLLCENYNATVIVSVSPHPAEQKIAEQICESAKHELINLGRVGLNISQLKSLISIADLMICNDTGPRHIAIALRRKIITLFGPNDPAWTQTGYEDEIQIVAQVDCAPCEKPKCKKSEHLCMRSITTDTVYRAAQKLLGKQNRTAGHRNNTDNA